MLDLRLDIHPVAWSILMLLTGVEDWPEPNYISAHAWYNGRERGIVIRAMRDFASPSLFMVFGECRNSDMIFLDSWIGEGDVNPATFRSQGYKEAYEQRSSFSVSEIGDVAERIRKEIEQFLTTKGTPSR